MAGSLPAEKLGELRQLIHGRISEAGVQEQIRAAISEILSQHGGRTLDEGTLLEALEERGLIEQVMKSLNLSRVSECAVEQLASHGGLIKEEGGEREEDRWEESLASPGYLNNCLSSAPAAEDQLDTAEGQLDGYGLVKKRCLYLQVLGGRAFLDHLLEPSPSCRECHNLFVLHVFFRGQRFKSRPIPCACEPKINESFLLEISKCCGQKHSRLHGNVSEEIMSYSSALGISDPIELVLTKTNGRDEGDLVGNCSVHWRQLLTETSGRSKLIAEMGGVCSEARITAGLLDIKLEIIPKASELLQNELLTAQLGLERQRNSERERLFLVYAKQWWKEYLQIRASHSQRLIKIFSPDEREMMKVLFPSEVAKKRTFVEQLSSICINTQSIN